MAQAAETLRAIGLELALEPRSSEAELAQRFAERSAAVAALLGPLLDCALELHDTAADESDEFPALRVGVAHGPAVARAGDWYGRPVNLASRITAIARPGSVLATREVRDAAPEGYRWSAAGRRSLRGIDGQVALYRARRADGESAGYS